MILIIKTSLRLFGLLTLLTGLTYPLAMTGFAQLFFPAQANGSIILDQDNDPIGSQWIGQPFTNPRYFWPRPSATSNSPYNAAASGGSNLSVLNESLRKRALDRITNLQKADPGNNMPVPIDLVSSSASGLDPHISPASAYYQASRISRQRGISLERVTGLIAQYTEPRFLRIFGEARVNVLLVNIALDRLQ